MSFRLTPAEVNVPRMAGGPKLTGRVDMDKRILKTPIDKASIEKTAVEKECIEKDASFGMQSLKTFATSPMAVNIGTNIATMAGTAALMGLAGAGIEKGRQMMGQANANKVIAEAMKINPRLSSYPPEQIRQYYYLILEASPTVAKNPLLVANYLEYLLNHDGSINFQGYKQLLDIEGQAYKNKVDRSPISMSAQKGLMEAVNKSVMDTMKLPTTKAPTQADLMQRSLGY